MLFDESHGEAWSIRPEVAGGDAARAPGGSVLRSGRHALSRTRFRGGRPTPHGPLSDDAPGRRRRARHRPSLRPRLGAHRQRRLTAFSAGRGRGHRALRRARRRAASCWARPSRTSTAATSTSCWPASACTSSNTTVFDYERYRAAPSWVPRRAGGRAGGAGAPAPRRTRPASTAPARSPRRQRRRACCCTSADGRSRPRAGLLAAVARGAGRVVVVADSDLFGDDYLTDLDHRQLWLNLSTGCRDAAFRSGPEPHRVSAAAGDPRLAAAQGRDQRAARSPGAQGRGRPARSTTAPRCAATSRRWSRAIDGPRAPLPAPAGVPRAGARATCAPGSRPAARKPDFMASLELVPARAHRRDGIEHLVVFPMYTPNGSPDTRFEALIVRTPWPEFIAQLEREHVRQREVRAGAARRLHRRLRQRVRGAVSRDRERGRRGRPTTSAASSATARRRAFGDGRRAAPRSCASTCRPTPPRWSSSADLARETYILWDLIHDRWHSHGDLPFDPFMIRQRLPYWMYSLEELRVDLATFGSAGELARERLPLRALRAVRDPLRPHPALSDHRQSGAQLRRARRPAAVRLPAPQRRRARGPTTGCSIDWERVEDSVAELRERVEELYRRGIDTSKVSYWIAAHDLVAEYVPPNVGSQWKREGRVYSDESDPGPGSTACSTTSSR